MTIPSDSSPYPSAGDVIDGKYRCDRILGIGGMGAVALATHLLRKAPVALKFMNPEIMSEPSAVERFINEAIAASRIDSEHVVKIFDVSQMADGAPYLVMEYLEGQDLAQILSREGKPGIDSLPRAVHFVLQVLRGLQVAHHAGIVHRDMKPSNCFVINREGEPDFVKLLDFGISKVQQPGGVSLTRTNSLLGTPLYMAPEQARSAKYADARTDLYATGVILYELLSGRTPFTTDTGEFTDLLLNIFSADPPALSSLRPDLPKDFCSVVHRSFSREPGARFQSAAEMIDGLAPWADERSRTVIESARRRAAREGSSPALASSAPPPLPALSRVAGPQADAASVHQPPGSAVLPRPEPPDSGLAASLARPGSPTLVRRRTGTLFLLAAALLAVGLAVGLFVLEFRHPQPDAQPAAVVSAEPPAMVPPSSAPVVAQQPPASASAGVLVVDPAPVASTTIAAPPTTPRTPLPATTQPPQPKPDAGRPRIRDIEIQQ